MRSSDVERLVKMPLYISENLHIFEILYIYEKIVYAFLSIIYISEVILSLREMCSPLGHLYDD